MVAKEAGLPRMDPRTARKLQAFADSQGILEEQAPARIAELYQNTSARHVQSITKLAVKTVLGLVLDQGVAPRDLEGAQALLIQQKRSLWGIPAERRSAISSENGIKLKADGKGIFKPDKVDEYRRNRQGKGVPPKIPKTPQERRADTRKAGAASRDSGKGIFGASVEDRSKWWRMARARSTESLVGKIEHREQHFDSYIEAAAGELLERFIPGFRLQRGENFQVIMGDHALRVDFIVEGVVVEYAPVILTIGRSIPTFETREELEFFRLHRDSLTGTARKDYVNQVKTGLKQRYTEKRRKKLDEAGEQDRELIVVTTPQELYKEVICLFGSGFPDSANDFKRLFNRRVKQIAKDKKGH